MTQLASHTAGTPYLGWYLGLAIGFAVVVVVVVVVAAILTYASRIADQANEAIEAADAAHQSTLGLWDMQRTNESLVAVLEAAREAGRALDGRR